MPVDEFSSVLDFQYCRNLLDHDHAEKVQPSKDDGGGALAAKAAEAKPPERRGGRLKVEIREKGIVSVLEEFIKARGQPTTDAHRLQTTVRPVGASLASMMRHAKDQGMDVSRSGVYVLLDKPRHNSKRSLCRGLIHARPGGLVAKEKKWHPRADWSAMKMNYASEFLTSRRAAGYRTAEMHVDAMSKTPYYIMAKDKSQPNGYLLKRTDDEPRATGCDHSFPLAKRCYLCTSAVSHCEIPADATEVLKRGKPHLRQSTPKGLDLFLRPYLYMADNAIGHMIDLWDSVSKRLHKIDAVMVGADNGAGYSVSELVVQHILWRMFRKFDWCYS